MKLLSSVFPLIASAGLVSGAPLELELELEPRGHCSIGSYSVKAEVFEHAGCIHDMRVETHGIKASMANYAAVGYCISTANKTHVMGLNDGCNKASPHIHCYETRDECVDNSRGSRGTMMRALINRECLAIPEGCPFLRVVSGRA